MRLTLCTKWSPVKGGSRDKKRTAPAKANYRVPHSWYAVSNFRKISVPAGSTKFKIRRRLATGPGSWMLLHSVSPAYEERWPVRLVQIMPEIPLQRKAVCVMSLEWVRCPVWSLHQYTPNSSAGSYTSQSIRSRSLQRPDQLKWIELGEGYERPGMMWEIVKSGSRRSRPSLKECRKLRTFRVGN